MSALRHISVKPARPLQLDPLEIFLLDHGPGQGSVTVTCYGSAWTAWWGAMGERTVAQFIAGTDSSYLSGCLQSEVTKRAKEGYCVRVAQAVIDACASATQDGAK